MKKASSFLLAIAIATSSFANATNNGTSVKTIIAGENLTSLKVYSNVEVVLTSDETNEIRIVGDQHQVDQINVAISHGELTITSSMEASKTGKLVVYVPSSSLEGVSIHGASTISSERVLNNDLIDVTINGQGRSTIRTAGMLNVHTIADFPLEQSAQ